MLFALIFCLLTAFAAPVAAQEGDGSEGDAVTGTPTDPAPGEVGTADDGDESPTGEGDTGTGTDDDSSTGTDPNEVPLLDGDAEGATLLPPCPTPDDATEGDDEA